MKNFIIAACLLFSIGAYSQQQQGRRNHPERQRTAMNDSSFQRPAMNDRNFQRPRNNWRAISRTTDENFLRSEEAKRVAEQVMLYQRITGGWPKNTDFAKQLTDAEREKVTADKQNTFDSTTDNNATTTEMDFLARMYNANGDQSYREAVMRGINYLLDGQYESGGWPQFWPTMHGYQIHITYNDGAMVNTMRLLEHIIKDEAPYNNIADKALKDRVQKAFNKGIECFLRTQIKYKGELTVWCQQHDRETLAPAKARAFELPSFCSSESAGIVSLLMDLEKPDKRVKKAIHAAMKWFDKYKLTGLEVKRSFDPKAGPDVQLIKNPDAPHPIWARYYDLEYCEPFVCDRDGVPRKHLWQIGSERRNGYGWYQDRVVELYDKYDAWANKYDKKNKLNITLNSKGANELGTIQLDRKPIIDTKNFDAVVKAGQSIQAAIEKAPANPEKPYKIFIKKGTYTEKVIIDRPNIVLVGENKDSTILVMAETAKTNKIPEYKGKPTGNGVIVLQEGADDCIISGLTVYNNYGTVVEPGNTTHQMAVFGRATRTIIINSNIYADGNDALSLWAKNGGMYYHADLNLRCPGVDFMCPRGWCYATRCKFYGDGRALIWHDGRGDKSQKLVITNSSFDAARPTILGRYHHDHQIYIANSKMSANILDTNISYAYSDKVLDPCPWGFRVYYWGCIREGGDSGWLRNNLSEAPGSPEYHTLTANWTFDGKWNPEERIRDLWYILAY